MEQWTDEAIILSARGHGENGAVASVLTRQHGRHNGYVYGAKSSKMRGNLEVGTWVEVEWSSRVSDQLGHFTFEQGRNCAVTVMDEPMKLAALLSACALCDVALPERETHEGLYHGMVALIDILKTDVWAEAYICWELAFLKELGFGLDLTRCVANGDARTLTYVSPKSGCAVSMKEGYPYRERLLHLPEFLKPEPLGTGADDIVRGLKLTGYFLEHWVFAHHTQGMPAARSRLQSLTIKELEKAA
jgi:DNA repair protein RecO (recombination protein O)